MVWVCSAGYEPVLEVWGWKVARVQSTRHSMCVPSWEGNGCGLSHIKGRAFHLDSGVICLTLFWYRCCVLNLMAGTIAQTVTRNCLLLSNLVCFSSRTMWWCSWSSSKAAGSNPQRCYYRCPAIRSVLLWLQGKSINSTDSLFLLLRVTNDSNIKVFREPFAFKSIFIANWVCGDVPDLKYICMYEEPCQPM